MSANEPKSMMWWYERLADWMLSNPDRYIKEAAHEFDVSIAWLYTIKNSQSFRIYYEERSAALSEAVDAAIVTHNVSVHEKITAAAEQAWDEIGRRLELSAETIPFDNLLQITKADLAQRGYTGGSKPNAGNNPPPNITVNIGVGSTELASAREKMKQLGDASSSAALPSPAQAGGRADDLDIKVEYSEVI